MAPQMTETFKFENDMDIWVSHLTWDLTLQMT